MATFDIGLKIKVDLDPDLWKRLQEAEKVAKQRGWLKKGRGSLTNGSFAACMAECFSQSNRHLISGHIRWCGKQALTYYTIASNLLLREKVFVASGSFPNEHEKYIAGLQRLGIEAKHTILENGFLLELKK